VLNNIIKCYEPTESTTEIKNTLKKVTNEKVINLTKLKQNLPYLAIFFRQKIRADCNFMKNILDSSYYINDPICYRLEDDGGDTIWLVKMLQNLYYLPQYFKGILKFKVDQGNILVSLPWYVLYRLKYCKLFALLKLSIQFLWHIEFA